MTWSATVNGTDIVLGTGEKDIRITGLAQSGRDPWRVNLAIPLAREDLLAEFVTTAKRIIRTAILELSWDDELWYRFRPTGATHDAGGNAFNVTFQDRRYNLSRRIAGRVGANPSLNDPLPTDETSLGSWGLFTTGSPTIDIAPMDPGDASEFGAAVRMSSDGAGPDYIYFTVDITADAAATRVVEWPGYILLPIGFWLPNAAGLMTEIVATDVDLAEVVDAQGWDVDLTTPQQQFLLPHPILTIPAGKHYSLEFRIYFQQGLILAEAFNATIQEVMSWSNLEVGVRVRDLIDRANGNTFGHSDTGLVVTEDSVPDTVVAATRVIYSKERQLISDCVTEAITSAELWTWLEPQLDGTDLYHADVGSTVAYVIDDTNAEPGGWQAQGDRQTDVLSVFAPDATEYTGDRLVVDFSQSGVLGSGSHDEGDELVEVGPFGGYDAKLAYQTVQPVWSARQVSGTETVRLLDLEAGIAAVVAGDLQTGNLIDDLVLASGYRGCDGNFRIAGITIDTAAALVTLDLNREADGS